MRKSIVSLCLFASLIVVPAVNADEASDAQQKLINDVRALQGQYISTLEAGDAKKALELNEKALALVSNVGVLWSDRGAIYLRMGNIDEALKAFDKAVELEPSSMVLAN